MTSGDRPARPTRTLASARTEHGMTMSRVAVVGSVNTDLVLAVPHHPGSGETVLATSLTTTAGGKGANQAVAVARHGIHAALIGAVGDDGNGHGMLEVLAGAGVDVESVETIKGVPTGLAVVEVDAAGENRIVVSSGANAAITPRRLSEQLDRIGPRAVLTQLELPTPVVAAALAAGRARGALTILNAAPVNDAASSLIRQADVLVVNEHEAGQLLDTPAPHDHPDALAAAHALSRRGPGTVVITLGPAGVVACDADRDYALPAVEARVVDTTGAGDAFCGGLTAGLARSDPLWSALDGALRAAAVAVSTVGAQLPASAVYQ